MPRLKIAGNTRKKKKCNRDKSFPCGYSCQAIGRNCRNPLKGQNKNSQEWLQSQAERLSRANEYLQKRKNRGMYPDADKPISLAELKDLRARIYSGTTNAAEIRNSWERFKNSEDLLLKELSKLSKKELTPYQGLGTRSSDTKERFVKEAMNSLRMQFSAEGIIMRTGETTLTQAIDRQMDGWTDQLIKEKADEYKERRRQRMEQIEAIKNPKTAKDYRERARILGENDLTDEQRRERDRLYADELKEKKASASSGQPANAAGLAYAVQKHTKTGEDLHTVKLGNRVDRAEYDALNTRAKQGGGYYSKYAKGFIFKSESDAKKFIDGTDLSNPANPDDAPKKNPTTEKIRQQAESLLGRAEESLGANRLTNTARRARMAAGIEERARKDEALAKTMMTIADAIDGNSVKFIDKMGTNAHFEMMEGYLQQAKANRIRKQDANEIGRDWERPVDLLDIDHISAFDQRFYPDAIARLGQSVRSKAGGQLVGNRLIKLSKSPDKDGLVSAKYGDLVKANRLSNGSTWQVSEYVDKISRLERMGITDDATFRTALREYFQYRTEKGQESPIAKAERELIGRKIEGYFPTPKPLADRVAQSADIEDGMSVLEPSAGKGSLIEAVQRTGKKVDISAAEANWTLREILKLKGIEAKDDFLKMTPEDGTFDRIVMNPPFENLQDIDHVRHAYDLLKPGGRIVAITSEAPFFRSDKKAGEFRDWLDDMGTSEKLPEGSFKLSDNSTGVNTRLVIIDKPKESTAQFSERRSRVLLSQIKPARLKNPC